MASWKSDFPKQWLYAEDLRPNEMYNVTIERYRVVAIQARLQIGARAQANKDVALDLREFRLPLKLNKKMCNRLTALFGTDDTDQWAGRRISIYRGLEEIYGKPEERIIIDDRPLPSLSPVAAPLRLDGTAQIPLGQISGKFPPEKIRNFLDTAASMNGSWDGFLAWAKTRSTAAYELVFGRPLDDIPGVVVPPMKAYLDHLKDAIDNPAPRQIESTAAPLPAGTFSADKPKVTHTPEEDIPF